MPNHFHLVVETPSGNLSGMMHLLNTSYTVYFNAKHERCGHLFQGRYKSILIEAVTYARELSRYIHLNPVRSKIVDYPEQYEWSSYGKYLGNAKNERWLETAVVLRLFSDKLAEARSLYKEYVTQGIGEEVPASIRNSVRKGILGSEEFIARIKRDYLGGECNKPDREKPQLRKLRKKPDLPSILSVSEKILGGSNKYLVPVVIFICHRNTALRLREIGEFFSLSISGVRNAYLRAQTAIISNAAIANAVSEIKRAVAEDDEQEGVKPTFCCKR